MTLPMHLYMVARLVSLGLRNKEIATEMGIAPGTVSPYIRAAITRLGLHNRFELAKWYLSQTGQLVELPGSAQDSKSE
jgi:DNA-binding NarL/FixJ family response regulator